jgi:AraC-like DNA-binding protein
VAAAIGTAREAAAIEAGGGIRVARLRAIQADIAAHVTDPALSVAGVAARHHITPRYLHKLFEHDGTTYSAFVLRLRLDRAHRALRDPTHAGLSISAVAFNAGFGDLSYFNRSFRRRFDATPSEVRWHATAKGAPVEGR